MAAKASLQETCRDLISGNHILHYHNVVDAYGHISVRHPDNPDIYLMCGYMAPALVRNKSDLVEYWVKDSSTVDPNAAKGYSERFIHGEIFSKYPEVNCVIHSHAEEVLPYVTTGVPLQPLYHMAGFLSSTVPIFDIDPMYKAGDQRDMLVNNQRFGAGLAAEFSSGGSGSKAEHNVVLMRRHGFTAVGTSIMQAVYRAIYTKINAELQTKSMTINNIWQASSADQGAARPFEYAALTDDQVVGCGVMAERFQDKPWRLWVHEVTSSNLYTNELL